MLLAMVAAVLAKTPECWLVSGPPLGVRFTRHTLSVCPSVRLTVANCRLAQLAFCVSYTAVVRCHGRLLSSEPSISRHTFFAGMNCGHPGNFPNGIFVGEQNTTVGSIINFRSAFCILSNALHNALRYWDHFPVCPFTSHSYVGLQTFTSLIYTTFIPCLY